MLLYTCAASALLVACVFIKDYARKNADFCRYHDDRHVAVGKWIDAHTPQHACIATHDVGAIAYYGKRKILDMVGLVTPELIARLRDEHYNLYLEQYLTENNITHIAVLSNWIEIENSNPLYSPVAVPEIIEVHAFNPGITHIQSRRVSSYNRQALRLVQQHKYDDSLIILQESCRLDPQSSKTLLYMGLAHTQAGRPDAAERYFTQALALFPRFVQAHFALAQLYARQGRSTEALAAAEKCLSINPRFAPARRLIQSITIRQAQ